MFLIAKKTLVVLFFLVITTVMFAQSPMRVMHYNLMLYGNPFACDEGNNNTNSKDGYLKTVIDYVSPDIFTVNELGSEEIYADRILNQVLNTDGINYWQRAGSTNTSWDSGIVNMMYYNSEKFSLLDQQYAYQSPSGPSLTRVIDRYTLYDNASALAGDTIIFHVVVAHLHASDTQMRTLQCEAAMEMIASAPPGNVIFSGDLNVDNSNEDSFQMLINYQNPAYNLYDPPQALGNWNNNSNYSEFHSQSTHQSGDCAAGGGMDDRFDFTLISDAIRLNSDRLAYVEGSYRVVGNDGDNFNQSLHISNNGDVPTNIAIALYSASDHLPIVTDYLLDSPVGMQQTYAELPVSVQLTDGILRIQYPQNSRYQIRIVDLQGRVWIEKQTIGSHDSIHLSTLSPAAYILSVMDLQNAQNTSQLFLWTR